METWTLDDLAYAAQWASVEEAEWVRVRVVQAEHYEETGAHLDDDGVWHARYPCYTASVLRSAQWVLVALAGAGCDVAMQIAGAYTSEGFARRYWRVFDRADIEIGDLAGWIPLLDETLAALCEKVAETSDADGVRICGVKRTPSGMRVLLSAWPEWAWDRVEHARIKSLGVCGDCGLSRKDTKQTRYWTICDECFTRLYGDDELRLPTVPSRVEEEAVGVIRGLLIGDPAYAGGLPPRWCAETRDGTVYRVDMAERTITSWTNGKRRSAKIVSISDPRIGERMTMRVAGIEAVGAREVVTSEIVALWREA